MAKRKPEPTDAEKAASLVGRTIVAAEWDGGDDGTDHWGEFETCLLTLDDGREVRFGGWGHDAWGATLDVALNEEAR